MTVRISYRFLNVFRDWGSSLTRRIVEKNLSPLSEAALKQIRQCVLETEANQIPGILVAGGNRTDGSALVMALNKKNQRTLWVFEDIGNPDWETPWEAETPSNAPAVKLAEKPHKSLNWAEFGIHPGKNNLAILHGLPGESVEINQAVAFAHLDGDWYPAISTFLQHILPRLSPGGMVLIDDYYDWNGCREAVDDYFREENRGDFIFSNKEGKLLVRRKGKASL